VTDAEAGQVGGIEALGFGVLVLVAGTLVLANAWAVVDAKLATAAAAREAARAYVEASTNPEGAGRQQAADAFSGAGRDAGRLNLSFRTSGGLRRCGRITVEASYWVPTVRLPVISRAAGHFEVRARHSELVDPYRAGLPGTAACAP
jgi:hypothetical protein